MTKTNIIYVNKIKNHNNTPIYMMLQINKAAQLLLHALLGATANAMTNDDLLSGAVSGVAGEVFAELLANKLYDTTNGNKLTQEQKTLLKEYGGLAGGLSSLIVGKLQGLDNQDITNNIYSGQRLGKNAVENNLVYQIVRDLDGNNPFKAVGNHSFDVWIPDNPDEATPEAFAQRGLDYIPPVDLGNGQEGWIMGAYDDSGNLVAQFNETTDQRALQNYFNNGGKSTGLLWDFDVETREVKPRDGISDTDFGFNLIANTRNYINNASNNPLNYGLIPASTGGYNCNSFSNALLQNSGANLNYNNDFKGTDLGRKQPVPNIYFSNNFNQTQEYKK